MTNDAKSRNVRFDSYDSWYAKANAHCAKKCGMSLEDLPDCAYRRWFNEGVTPSSAAARAIREAKKDYGLA